MRTVIVLGAMLGSVAIGSNAAAQFTFSHGPGGGALPFNSGMRVSTIPIVGVYPTYPGAGMYGSYLEQSYYGGFPALSGVGAYGGSTLQPINGLYPAQPSPRNPIYGNYGGYSQFGFRRYGSGRMFGSYIPRVYTIYQPRMGGLFDR